MKFLCILSSSEIQFSFWTVIHPRPRNGEHSCPGAWADGSAPLSADPEQMSWPPPPSWAHLPPDSVVQERQVYPCWTWWGLTLLLGKGTGWVGQADFTVTHALCSETWARRPFDSLYHLTPWHDIIRDCFCLEKSTDDAHKSPDPEDFTDVTPILYNSHISIIAYFFYNRPERESTSVCHMIFLSEEGAKVGRYAAGPKPH